MEESHWWLQLSGLQKKKKRKKFNSTTYFSNLNAWNQMFQEAASHRRTLGLDQEPLGLFPPGPKPGAVPTVQEACDGVTSETPSSQNVCPWVFTLVISPHGTQLRSAELASHFLASLLWSLRTQHLPPHSDSTATRIGTMTPESRIWLKIQPYQEMLSV